MATLADLRKTAKSLHPAQLDLLVSMAAAMSRGVEERIESASDIVSAEFNVNFSNRLIIHHATHDEVFKKKSFEYAFCGASRAAGRSATIVSNPTNPGTDVIVDGTSFSLKTEAARSINPNKIKISKLMEARWIRDCKTKADFARETSRRVTQHLQEYERILVLRAFDRDTEVQYDLVEIPRDLLLLVRELVAKDFTRRRQTSGGSSAKITVAGQRAFSLRLDGSVEKVMIEGLSITLCVSHGTWIIPKSHRL